MATRSTPLGRLLTALAAATLAPLAAAQDPMPLGIDADRDRGRELAYTCSGCHGVPSAVNVYPTYHVPKLGGQHAEYIEVALQGYRAGARAHDTMHAQTAQLSDQDIADLAAYFASLEGRPETGTSAADAAAIANGKANSATCQACHGESGQSPSPRWPNLAGQHASYLIEALEQYRNGERDSPVMAPLVSALDDDSLAAIAAFYAAQPGLYTLKP